MTGACPGAKGTKYYPYLSLKDDSATFHHICRQPLAANWSPEELRWADVKASPPWYRLATSFAGSSFCSTTANTALDPVPAFAPFPPAAPSGAAHVGAAPLAGTDPAAGQKPPAPATAPAPAPAATVAASKAAALSLDLQAGSQISLKLEPGGSLTLRLAAPAGQPLNLTVAAGAAPATAPLADAPPAAVQPLNSDNTPTAFPQQQQEAFFGAPILPAAGAAAAIPGTPATVDALSSPGANASLTSPQIAPACLGWGATTGAAPGSAPASKAPSSPTESVVSFGSRCAAAALSVPVAAPKGRAEGLFTGGSFRLTLKDGNWKRAAAAPEWRFRALDGGRLLCDMRVDEAAGEKLRICRADSTLVLLVAGEPAGGVGEIERGVVWRLAPKHLSRLAEMLGRAATENVCGMRLWSKDGKGLMRRHMRPGAAKALRALNRPAGAAPAVAADVAPAAAESVDVGAAEMKESGSESPQAGVTADSSSSADSGAVGANGGADGSEDVAKDGPAAVAPAVQEAAPLGSRPKAQGGGAEELTQPTVQQEGPDADADAGADGSTADESPSKPTNPIELLRELRAAVPEECPVVPPPLPLVTGGVQGGAQMEHPSDAEGRLERLSQLQEQAAVTVGGAKA